MTITKIQINVVRLEEAEESKNELVQRGITDTTSDTRR